MHNNERVNLPRLIMNQFRWLDHIVNSQVWTVNIMGLFFLNSLRPSDAFMRQ